MQRHQRTRSLVLFIVLLVTSLGHASSDPPSPPPSSWAAQCTACRNYVECGRAYHGRAGKFCFDNPASGAACCCPLSARCVWYRLDAQCYCDEMILGEYTPLAVGLCGVGFLVATIRKWVCPPRPRTRDARSSHHVTEQSRLLAPGATANSTSYGAVGVSTGEAAREGIIH